MAQTHRHKPIRRIKVAIKYSITNFHRAGRSMGCGGKRKTGPVKRNRSSLRRVKGKLSFSALRIVAVAIFHAYGIAFFLVNEKFGFLPAAYFPSRFDGFLLCPVRTVGTRVAFAFNDPFVVAVHHMLILFHNRKFLSFRAGFALPGQIFIISLS